MSVAERTAVAFPLAREPRLLRILIPVAAGLLAMAVFVTDASLGMRLSYRMFLTIAALVLFFLTIRRRTAVFHRKEGRVTIREEGLWYGWQIDAAPANVPFARAAQHPEMGQRTRQRPELVLRDGNEPVPITDI